MSVSQHDVTMLDRYRELGRQKLVVALQHPELVRGVDRDDDRRQIVSRLLFARWRFADERAARGGGA